jgi:hypothetical protein
MHSVSVQSYSAQKIRRLVSFDGKNRRRIERNRNRNRLSEHTQIYFLGFAGEIYFLQYLSVWQLDLVQDC